METERTLSKYWSVKEGRWAALLLGNMLPVYLIPSFIASLKHSAWHMSLKKTWEDLRTNRPNISKTLQIYQTNPISQTLNLLDHQSAIKEDQKSVGKVNDLLAWVCTKEDITIVRLVFTGNESKTTTEIKGSKRVDETTSETQLKSIKRTRLCSSKSSVESRGWSSQPSNTHMA